ncbi:hypothetical protein ZOSMA_117G00610 [Zostera marina]|uniref:Uncharacterized protein n=1 Tax=Zostera marina TaxID=29655 RepID=A0A0K9P419_ZOSMR|nr:hypothetical protein ZOSMA_39G00040 [Zostera marina]KMZ75244.1 hypothetical protein ZOSMA_117G00610 [Zostera marina]
MWRLWNHDHTLMQTNLPTIYLILVSYTTKKIYPQMLLQQGGRFWVKMAYEYIARFYIEEEKQVYTIRHDITDVKSLMPGLLLAIRKVARLKNLIYGLEKFILEPRSLNFSRSTLQVSSLVWSLNEKRENLTCIFFYNYVFYLRLRLA